MLIRIGKRNFWVGRFIRKISIRLLLLLLGTAITLVIGEGYFRCFESNPSREAYDFHRQWGEKLQRNSFSFRDIDHDVEKGVGARRVVFLGDSYTEAIGVNDQEMFTSRFLAHWQEKVPGVQAEVMNMGRGGWSTTQEVEFYREHGRQFTPDILVLCFVLNDPEVEWYTPDCIFTPEWDWWVESRSHLFSFIKKRYVELRGEWGLTPDFAEYTNMLFSNEYPGWPLCQESLAELAKICREDGTVPVLAIFPIFDEWGNFSEIHTKIRVAAEENGFLTVDLLPAFVATNQAPRSFWVHPEDGHPSAEAHEICADEILTFLLEQDDVAVRLLSGDNPQQ